MSGHSTLAQWATILTTCLMGPAQEAANTLLSKQAANYKMKPAILSTFNVAEESYYHQLQKTREPTPGSKIKAHSLRQLKPTVHVPEEIGRGGTNSGSSSAEILLPFPASIHIPRSTRSPDLES